MIIILLIIVGIFFYAFCAFFTAMLGLSAAHTIATKANEKEEENNEEETQVKDTEL